MKRSCNSECILSAIFWKSASPTWPNVGVSLVQNSHVLKQVPTHTPDPALSDALLPRTAKSSSDWFDVAFSDRRDDISRELRVPVEDQVPIWLVVSPSFLQLQYDP